MEDKNRPSFVRIRWRRRRRPEEGEERGEPPPEGERPVEQEAPEHRELHTRVVVPRQQRGSGDTRPELDIELREVRYGATSRGPYLRIVPRQRRFMRHAPGYLEATPLASRPVDTLGRYVANLKQAVIGGPFATSQAIHERLSKLKALAILGSDPLSSSAYATEEMLIVLALAGSGAFTYGLPIAGVIAMLLGIVALSYRQTVRAYPGGGGAYLVASENLGRGPAMLAGALEQSKTAGQTAALAAFRQRAQRLGR